MSVGTANSVRTPVGVIRPTCLSRFLRNQRLPSGPAAIPSRVRTLLETENSPRSSPGTMGGWSYPRESNRADIFPILLESTSVNQRWPSGPDVIPNGPLPEGSGNSKMAPLKGLTRPIWLAPRSVNQMLPSTEAVMPAGWLFGVGMGNSLTTPAGVTRPILFPDHSVNQRLPSRPTVIWFGTPPEGMKEVEMTPPLGVRRTMLGGVVRVNQRL